METTQRKDRRRRYLKLDFTSNTLIKVAKKNPKSGIRKESLTQKF